MSCACIKKYFDLHVSFRDCKTIVIEDQSDWMQGESYDEPSEFKLDVFVPSRDKEFAIILDPSKRNIYTSVDLFGSESNQCLPDDILCFSVESCGLLYKINRAFTCRAQCKLDELTSKAKTKEDFEEIQHLKSLLEGVHINAKLGKSDTASELLQIVNKKLKHITCGACQ